MNTSTAVRPRMVPTPPLDPPFDDCDPPGTGYRARRLDRPVEQGTLALGFRLRAGSALIPAAPVRRSAEPAGASRREPGRSAPREPEPARWCNTFAQALVEVLDGVRPAAQLMTWTTRPVHGLVERRAALALAARPKARLGHVPPQRHSAPAPTRLGNLHLCLPTAGVVEANAVLHQRGRARALAFRLEAQGGRWICTALELG